jgi:glycosyltransferase involved in cell wall biosynthesis
MTKPRVSVVIPAFNREREIRRAIESCLTQRFTDYQVVVVDDGSTDGTCEAVRSYGDSRIKLVCHDTNRGMCPARNTGVASATADWVLFLDSDDELLPGALGEITSRTVPGEAGVDRLAFCYLCDDNRISPTPGFDNAVVDYEAYVRWTGFVQLSDCLYCVRRTTFEQMRFPDCRIQDLPYHFEFARRFKTRVFPDILAKLHTDARNRLSDCVTNKAHEAARFIAAEEAEGMIHLLADHGPAMRAYAPRTYEVCSRMAATYRFLAGERLQGCMLALKHLGRHPMSLHSWVIPGLGLLGPRALQWGTAFKTKIGRTFRPHRSQRAFLLEN